MLSASPWDTSNLNSHVGHVFSDLIKLSVAYWSPEDWQAASFRPSDCGVVEAEWRSPKYFVGGTPFPHLGYYQDMGERWYSSVPQIGLSLICW